MYITIPQKKKGRCTVLTSSYFFMDCMNSKCCFSSSSWATFCSLSWNFCCITESSSLSHAFSWHRRRTWALSFCFSASTVLKWLPSAIMTWQRQQKEYILFMLIRMSFTLSKLWPVILLHCRRTFGKKHLLLSQLPKHACDWGNKLWFYKALNTTCTYTHVYIEVMYTVHYFNIYC